MSPLRERMIEDMTLAGLALGTRQAYTQAVRRLAVHCRRSPDQLSEEEVHSCLLEWRKQGAARGTFKIGLCRPRFLYQPHSVVVGICSGKKGSSCLGRSGCLMRYRMIRSGNYTATSATDPGHASPPCMPAACASASHPVEICSIDRANQVLRIIGKGDKERLVLLPQPVLDELGTLWRTHRNPRWLFPNRCGDGPLNQRVLSHTFAAAADRAGIRSGVTSHALRHSTRHD